MFWSLMLNRSVNETFDHYKRKYKNKSRSSTPPTTAQQSIAPPTNSPPSYAPPTAYAPPTCGSPNHEVIEVSYTHEVSYAGAKTLRPPEASSEGAAAAAAEAATPPCEGPRGGGNKQEDKKSAAHTGPDTPGEGAQDGDKSGTAAPSSAPVAASESSICRICQEGRSKEELISPCRCSGTIGKMHLSCLEHWLQLMHRSSCELCKYEFPVERIAQPLHRFFLNPGSNTEFANLVCDISCFLILTPLLVITMFLCTRGVKYYDEHGKIWSMLAVITLLGSLVIVYISWAVLAFLYHYRIWRAWRHNTMEIRMCVDRANRMYITKPTDTAQPPAGHAVGRMERGAAPLHPRHLTMMARHHARPHAAPPLCQCPMSVTHQEIAELRAERARSIIETFYPGYFGPVGAMTSSGHQDTVRHLTARGAQHCGATRQKKTKVKKSCVKTPSVQIDLSHCDGLSSTTTSFLSPSKSSSLSSDLSSMTYVDIATPQGIIDVGDSARVAKVFPAVSGFPDDLTASRLDEGDINKASNAEEAGAPLIVEKYKDNNNPRQTEEV